MPSLQRRSPALVRAVSLARRRLFTSQLSDTLGWCGVVLLGACVVSVALAWAEQRSAIPWTWAAGVIGSAGVLVRGLKAIPTELRSAMELDRRNHLSDLLSTAWVSASGSDPWAAPVQNMAEVACGRLNQPPLTGRFSPRLHAAGGLALATCITGLLLLRDEPFSASGTIAPPASAAPHAGASTIAFSKGFQRSREAETDMPLPGREQPNAERPIASDTGTGGNPSGTGDDARGGGRADANLTVPRPNSDSDAAARPSTPPGTDPAAGSGIAAASTVGTGTSAGTLSAGKSSSQAPPWSLPDWADSREAAEAQVRSGQVPDAYRGMVKAYFDR